jgi:hypothetical protein
LAPAGDAVANYAMWSDKFIDFMSNYRSCYSGVPLSYLVHDNDASKLALSTTYESLDKFLVASIQLDASINPAFANENKVLAAVLSKAISTSCGYATDLTLLLSRGHGQAAWIKLKVRVNGTAKALFARVQMLEMRLKDPFDGSSKGFQAIQLHNSAFLKTVQDLNVAGNPITDDQQVCDYLMTIHDPILLPLKDSIRAEGGVQLLEEVQQKFVDIVEGYKADAMAQVKQHHQNIHLTKAPWGNQDRKQPNKHDAGKKN